MQLYRLEQAWFSVAPLDFYAMTTQMFCVWLRYNLLT